MGSIDARCSMWRLLFAGLFAAVAFPAWAGPPDFVHAADPHIMSKNAFALPTQTDQYRTMKPMLGPFPLMVILVEFQDARHDADYTPAYYDSLIFGPDPSVNGYYQEVSYGKFSLARVGVLGWYELPDSASTYYFGPTDIEAHYTELGAAAVQAAVDDGVDFSPYDSNHDNEVTPDELIIQMVFAPHTPYMGQTSWVQATRVDQHLPDGVMAPGGLEIDTWAVRGEETGNLQLFAHELGHGVLSLPDLYGDDLGGDPTGPFSLMASLPATHTPHLSAWAKLHLGWLKPNVVTQSGYYLIPAAAQNPTVYILYDPFRGEDEYFIVENRWPQASTYEAGLDDQGLAIWHITEFYDDEPFSFLRGRKMVAMKWAGGDGAVTSPPYSALWDCGQAESCYDLTPISSPRDSRWEDGTNSRIVIREVSVAADTMSAYFDIGTSTADITPTHANVAILYASVPNPVRQSATIRYDLVATRHISLGVYDLAGRRVALLSSGTQVAGSHQVEWRPEGLASGVYYYRLSIDDGPVAWNKLVLIN